LFGFGTDAAFLFLDDVAGAGTGEVEDGLPSGLAVSPEVLPALQRLTAISD